MRLVDGDRAVTSFGPGVAPIAEARIGEVLEIETVDCYDEQIDGVDVLRPSIDMHRFNRATGPIRIEGVAAGEWVAIVVDAIELHERGVMAMSPGLGVLGDRVPEPSTRMLRIDDGHAWLTDEIGIPICPMIGVLGVATAGDAISTESPGAHGGNLDTPRLCVGSALVVRAQEDGLGLAVGDLHAAQGDGELGGTGIEIGGRVRLRVERIEHDGSLPLLVDATGIAVLASAETIDDAIRHAFAEGVELLQGWHDLSWADAHRLASVVCDARVSQIVNPSVTARLEIPAAWHRLAMPSTAGGE